MKYPEQLIQFARMNNLENDEEVSTALEFCLLDPSLIPEVKEIMLAKINNQNNHSENSGHSIVNPDPFPPPADEIQGDIKIGHVVQTGNPVCLKLDSLNRNILITGAHGTGKTNMINLIIKGLLEK
jgi:Cdc6-like AAA superfamily ATPase